MEFIRRSYKTVDNTAPPVDLGLWTFNWTRTLVGRKLAALCTPGVTVTKETDIFKASHWLRITNLKKKIFQGALHR